MGSRDSVRAELQSIMAGPPKATVREFAGQLGKLALHFWRPDFSAEQARLLYGDFIQDMDGVTAEELADACRDWRNDPLNRFFPTPGMLKELVREGIVDRARQATGAKYLLDLLGLPDGDIATQNPASDRLHDLAEKLRAKSGERKPEPVSEVLKPAILNTARAHTDAAELTANLKKRNRS